jgi:altronate dehydratase small subunit
VAERRPPERPRALLLDARDTVAVVLAPLQPGASLDVRRGEETVRVVAEAPVPFGHKIAVVPMGAGAPVIKYGETIGYATSPIRPGDHVHVHNVRSDRAGSHGG